MPRVFSFALAATLAVAAFASTAALADAGPCRADAGRIRSAAEALVAIGPRPDSSDEAGRAADHLDAALSELGLEPHRHRIGAVDVPEIAVGSWVIRSGGPRRSASDNVWVRLGPDGLPARLLMAHYDTVGGSPGAVDNAGAVAVLLELARCLRERRPPRPVIIAFTGAEEIGLLGARALLRERVGAPLELAVSLDLVGHQRPLAINGVSALWGQRRLEWLAARVDAAGAGAYVALPHRLVSRLAPQLERSDHGPFTAAGVPAIHLYGRGPERIYLAYHSPFDTADRLDDRALVDAFDLAAELATAAADLPEPGGDLGMWIDHPLGPSVVSSAVAIVAEVALLVAAIALVVVAIRRRRRDVDRARRGLGLAAVVGLLAGAWLIAGVGMGAARRGRDPLEIVLDLSRYHAATLILAVATFGLGLALLGRRWPLVRGVRFQVAAAIIAAIPGLALLVAGAFELAWLPLASAALFAAGAALLERRFVGLVVTATGAALAAVPAAPAFLAESVFHGFYPTAVPLAAALGLLLAAPALALTGALRAAIAVPTTGRIGRAVIGALAALWLAGLLLLVAPGPPCSSDDLGRYGAACELARVVDRDSPKP